MNPKITRTILAIVLLGFSTLADAAAPTWYRAPTIELRVQENKTLPGGTQFYSPSGKVFLRPNADPQLPKPLELVVGADTGMVDATFVIGSGGRMRFTGTTLRRVVIICEPGGEVVIEDSDLKEVWFPKDNGYSGDQSPAPRVAVERCTFEDCMIDSAQASGLAAKNCRFVRCEMGGTEKDGANPTSSYTRCHFQDCTLNTAEVVMASSECDFRDCTCNGTFSDTLGSYLPKPVLVRLAWKGKQPATLPAQAGKVHFEVVEQVFGPNEAGATPKPEAEWRRRYRQLRTAVKLLGADGQIAVGSKDLPPPSIFGSRGSGPPTSSGAGLSAVIAKGLTFKSRIVGVNGLLISQLSSGEEAGQVTKMSLTALPSLGDSPSTLKFNQDVGADMKKALNEVSKFAQLRHGGLPAGHAIELGFADKYISKDGPSAAVACALLLEGAITGKEWDPTFAVTGDMNADGSVQPIGGVQAKVRGATKGGCKIVGIPIKNEKALSDILILEGPGPLLGIGIFGVAKFEDALALASPERPQKLQLALNELENVRNVLSRMSGTQMLGTLRSKAGQDRLRYILEAAPNCYSAKHLLLYAMGRGPRSLSIGGSIEAADSNATGLIRSIENDIEQNVSTLKGDDVGTSINKLKNLRPKLDPRVWPYVDNVIAYGEVIRSSILNPVRSGARYRDLVGKARAASSAAKSAFESLTGDPQVREELGL